MVKIISLLFVMLFPVSVSSDMFPSSTPRMPAMCWTTLEEAIHYHINTINEDVVAMGKTSGDSWIIVFSHKEKKTWSVVATFANASPACAFIVGTRWANIPFETFEFPPPPFKTEAPQLN